VRTLSVIGIAVLLSLMGCASRLDRARAEALKKIDVAQCQKDGGEIRGVCMFGFPACVKRFSDAGKACTDSSQCEGMCWVQENTLNREPGPTTSGVCQDTTDTCGCWEEVKDGQLSGNGICAD
jgi:hypothetical protein